MSGANEEDVEKDEEEYNDADDVDEEMTELGIEFAKEEDEVDKKEKRNKKCNITCFFLNIHYQIYFTIVFF